MVEPVVLRPQKRARLGPSGSNAPKMIQLPQTLALWSNDDELNMRKLGKSLHSVARFNGCQALSDHEIINKHEVSRQVRIWQDRKRYTALEGKYVAFSFDFLHKLETTHPLTKEYFTGGVAHAGDKCTANAWDAISGLEINGGSVFRDFFTDPMRVILFQIPIAF